MSSEAFKLGLLIAGLTGLLLAILMCILFGVLDVQCNDKAPYWNAKTQKCQPKEVVV